MPRSQPCGVPDSRHAVDLRVSSLMALARGLGLEVVLIPRRALPAVRSIARGLDGVDEPEPRPAYSLDVDDDGR